MRPETEPFQSVRFFCPYEQKKRAAFSFEDPQASSVPVLGPRVLADNRPEQTSDRYRMNLQGDLRLYDRGGAIAWPICLPSCVLRPLGTPRRLAAVHLPSY